MDQVTKLRPVPLRMGSAGGKTAFEIVKSHLGANGASGYLPLDSQREINFPSSSFLCGTGGDVH